MTKRFALIVGAFILAGAMVSNASAGGLIGDVVNTFAPGVGTALDDVHKRVGSPLNELANPAVGGIVSDMVFPGSGQYVAGALQGMQTFNSVPYPAQPYRGMPYGGGQWSYAPPVVPYYGPATSY